MKIKNLLCVFCIMLFNIGFLILNSFAQTPGEWTWMHGDNMPNSLGSFGAQGVTNSTNTPPALYEPCEWKDNNGNFWLLGGASPIGLSAVLWKYDPITNQWAWMKGTSAVNQPGVYGTKGVSSLANYPGARGYGVVTWPDASGNLWLFGGFGYDAVGGLGLLNDLWKYNITLNEWTWIKGPNTINDPGSYGTQGMSNLVNLPASRSETPCSWTDNAGNLWLYGGVDMGGYLGDLWKYDISINEWAWMHGSNTITPPAVYGTLGVAAPANTPGGRQAYCSWTDLSGNFWLFGGRISGASTKNDLWKYDIAVNQWTWMKGPNTPNNLGNYGTRCIPATTNLPPSRFENRARVQDSCGNVWNFGGEGWLGYFNDLWHYNVSTNQWTWVSGNNIPNQAAVYGTKGISGSANKPEAKKGSVSWMDNNGYIWVFGGELSSANSFCNDLFRYVPDPACVPISSFVIAISSNTTICIGQSATLTASGGISYSWSPGGQSTSGVVTSPTTSTTYTVTGSNGCTSGSSTVTVIVSSYPSITASAGTTICNGQSAILTASGGMSYLWFPGGQSTSSVVVNPAVSTTYTVTGSNANICTVTAEATIIVNPIPTATAWNNVTITAGSSSTLNSSSSPSGTYNWLPVTGLSCITCQNPNASPIATTVYCVTVTDANNCTDTACVTVTIEPIDCSNAGELYIPNAFSPNGDNENDVLKLYYGTPQCIKTFKLVIYDRWGEKVFQTKNPVAEWDGYYRGKLENTAVFVYYLEATRTTDEKITKKGNISLIR